MLNNFCEAVWYSFTACILATKLILPVTNWQSDSTVCQSRFVLIFAAHTISKHACLYVHRLHKDSWFRTMLGRTWTIEFDEKYNYCNFPWILPCCQMGKINSFDRQLWESQIEERDSPSWFFVTNIHPWKASLSKGPLSLGDSGLLRPPVCLLLRPPQCCWPESTKSVCDLCLSSCLSGIPKSQSVAPGPYST